MRAQVAADLRAAAEVLRVFEELFAGGPDTACRTTWRSSDVMPECSAASTECVEVPMADLRDAFDRAAALAADATWQAGDETRERELDRLAADARGIDPNLMPPSLESLLAGAEFADALSPATPASPSPGGHERHWLDGVPDVSEHPDFGRATPPGGHERADDTAVAPVRRRVCRFHPELGEQHVTRMFHRDRPSDVQDVLLCIGCMKESKPYGPSEFAS